MPLAVRGHLRDRVRTRDIDARDLGTLLEWINTEPSLPDRAWCKDFGSFKLVGEGANPKDVLDARPTVLWATDMKRLSDRAPHMLNCSQQRSAAIRAQASSPRLLDSRTPGLPALLLTLLTPFGAWAQSTESLHQTLEKIKGIGLSEKTRDKVEPMLESAVEGWEKSDPRSPQYAQTLTMLGMVRQSRADLDMYQLRTNVEPLYRKALAIYARSFATADDADLALTLELRAYVLGFIGQVQDATPLRERAETIRKARVRELQEGARKFPSAFKIGNGISAPVVTYKVEPDYTEIARFMRQQGTVNVRLVVDENGVPQDISLIHSAGFGLDEKAVQTVRTWRFRPGQDGSGQNVPVIVNVELNFRLL